MFSSDKMSLSIQGEPGRGYLMKPKKELEEVITQIQSEDSPVGMDAVYVHALILDRLSQIDQRLDEIESRLNAR